MTQWMLFVCKFIFKELKIHPRFTALFIINSALGLCGFIAIDLFKQSLNSSLQLRSKAILGADLSLSARRPLNQQERQIVFQKTAPLSIKESKVVQMYSMVSSQQNQSALVNIKSIQNNYPFYGQLKLNQASNQQKHHQWFHQKQLAWVYPEILIQLKVKIGDSIRIGNTLFQISEVIEHDPSNNISTQMAPRIYISLNHLEKTNLLQHGSLAWHSFLYHIPNQTPNQLQHLRNQIFQQMDDPQIKVKTHQNASESISRLLQYLSDFLSLTALCALFLTCIAIGFLFRSYFQEKTYQIALLLSLGMTRLKTFSLYLFYIVALGIFSFITSSLLAIGLFPIVQNLTKTLLPFSIEFQTLNLTGALFLSILTPLIVCLPVLFQIQKIKVSKLLHSHSYQTAQKNTFINISFLLLGVIIFWWFAVQQSHSLKLGSLFTWMLVMAGSTLAGIGWLVLRILGKSSVIQQINNLRLRWTVRDLARHSQITLLCFLSIGLGTLLLNIIPQIQQSIASEISHPSSNKQPSLFLFDIQENQVDPLKKILQKHQVSIDKITPLIKARLIAINQKTFDKGEGSKKQKTREKEREMRFRNRGFNLSYRHFLYPSEKIIQQSQKKSTKLSPISIEKRFASRLNIHLDDVLTFRIENQTIKGIVTNIRSVHWLSFDPNFFLVFQDDSLKPFFKTFLATIPYLPHDKKTKVQNDIVSSLQNVSIINISRFIQELFSLSKQMTTALILMAILCLVVGFFVFYSICSFQSLSRRKDIGLLKILGVPFQTIQMVFLYSSVWIALTASLFGTLFSMLVSFFISYLFFDQNWVFSFKIPLFIFIITVFFSVALTSFANRSSLRQPTKQLLF